MKIMGNEKRKIMRGHSFVSFPGFLKTNLDKMLLIPEIEFQTLWVSFLQEANSFEFLVESAFLAGNSIGAERDSSPFTSAYIGNVDILAIRLVLISLQIILSSILFCIQTPIKIHINTIWDFVIVLQFVFLMIDCLIIDFIFNARSILHSFFIFLDIFFSNGLTKLAF